MAKRRLPGGVGALLAGMLMTGHPARAAGFDGWPSLADSIFRPISTGTGQTPLVLPEAFTEDTAGFLWEGSQNGLARWDGYQFRLYTADARVPDGLADHEVRAVHRDAAGRLWVGTLAGGLASYDNAADRFVPLKLPAGTGFAKTAEAIVDDGAGGLWVGTDLGLFHVDQARQVIAWRHAEPGKPASLPAGTVNAVVLGRDGTLWAGGPFGLVRSRAGQGGAGQGGTGQGGTGQGGAGDAGFVPVPLPLPVAGDPAPEVLRLVEDGAGRVWIGTASKGAFVIAPGGVPVQVPTTGPASGSTAAAEVSAIIAPGPDEVWIGTMGHGIVVVDPHTMRTRHLMHDPFGIASLDRDMVSALYRDRAGLIWVGTTAGISQYDPGNRGILSLSGSTNRNDGLRLEDISGVLPRDDGGLWLGSQHNGVQILEPSGHEGAVLDVDRVYNLAPGFEGGAIVASRDGLFAVNRDATKLTRLVIPGRSPYAMVRALLWRGNRLWIGGEDGVWELRVDPVHNRAGPPGPPALAVARHLEKPVLTDSGVMALATAPDGRIAIATENGFTLLDPESGAAERILPEKDNPTGLTAPNVYCFANDQLGRLWVGSSKSGLYVLLRRDAAGRPVFRHIGRAEGLPDSDISRILLDRQGRVWASTDNGLAMIDPATFAVRALGVSDGVAVTSYWNNSGAVTQAGDLVFGGVEGITIVREADVRPWTYRPPVVFTGIKAGGGVLNPDAVQQEGGAVQVPADANSLTVEFAALDFSAPEANAYAYRLDGFDRGWVAADAAHRVATYTNLPPGGYTLRVRGSNRAGLWNDQEAVLPVTVLPAWYQAMWFHMAEGLAALLAVTGVVQARTMFLRQRQRGLEREVAERTAELLDSQRRLEHFAYFDSLTALPNRRAFSQHFEMLIEERGDAPFALVLVDLDGFKKVNDSLGHVTGDALLVAAADRMRNAVRDGDFIARLGGDEFAILISDVATRQDVDHVCARIVASMQLPFNVKGVTVRIGASLGTALYPQHGSTQDMLYRRVDLALYEAKRSGRGIWCWYGDSLTLIDGQDD